MRKVFLRTLLLFGVLIGAQGIVFGQSSIQDSCICYTDKQDKRCLECLINAPKKDSIINLQNEHISILNKKLNKSYREILDRQEKLKRTRVLGPIIGGSIVGGIVFLLRKYI